VGQAFSSKAIRPKVKNTQAGLQPTRVLDCGWYLKFFIPSSIGTEIIFNILDVLLFICPVRANSKFARYCTAAATSTGVAMFRASSHSHALVVCHDW
jgi:hypothetical protein